VREKGGRGEREGERGGERERKGELGVSGEAKYCETEYVEWIKCLYTSVYLFNALCTRVHVLTFSFTYSLPPWGRVLLEKLTGS